MGVRNFLGARTDETLLDLPSTGNVIDRDVWVSQSILMHRGRFLVKNTGYGSKYMRMLRQNVVGAEGFLLQVKSYDFEQVPDRLNPGSTIWTKRPDEFANSYIEEAWREWSNSSSVSINTNDTFRLFTMLVLTNTAMDGEVFIRLRRGYKGNKYRFELEMITSEYLDLMDNRNLQNGNFIRMGIEHDPAGKPVAYWFTVKDPALDIYMVAPNKKVRVPAEEIIHLYHPEFVNQTRGLSWFASALINFHHLAKYTEASLKNARVSQKLGWYERSAEAGDYVGEEDERGSFIEDFVPGEIFIAPAGYKFNGFDPKFPSEQYGAFTKAITRELASAMGVSYNTLANDLEGVNYSSIRAGLLDEREFYKEVQNWLKEKFLNPVFSAWLEMFLVSPDTRLPFSKFDKFNKPTWRGRSWPWVDPLKDSQAQEMALRNGFKTRRQILAESGLDYEETMLQLAAEKEYEEKLGLKFGDLNAPNQNSPATTSEGDDGQNNSTQS